MHKEDLVMHKEDMNAVWQQYYKKRDLKTKEMLTEHYVHLVKLVAGRLGIYLNQYIDLNDLIGYGILGLIDAIDKFDPNKNVKFETYASLRIRGAILDAIRKLDWVPRTLRKKQKEIDRTYMMLEMKLSRAPHEEEVAEALGVTREDYVQLLKEVSVASILSIDENIYTMEMIDDKEAIDPNQQIEENEMRQTLAHLIDGLPEREKKVICLYYYEELTLKEISKVLEVSESRVSQLHTKAVSRLRGHMTKYHLAIPI